MIELEKRAKEIDIRRCTSLASWSQAEVFAQAIRLVHGSGDRVTSHIGTLKLFDRLPNDDKEIEIYEGYEHGTLWSFFFPHGTDTFFLSVMLKVSPLKNVARLRYQQVGRDEADDAQRQRVLADWREWLLQRCRN